MSDDRAVNVTNCTIYVGQVRIVLESCPNADGVANGVTAETRATEDRDDFVTDTPAKQKDIVSDCRTMSLGSQRHLCTTQYAARQKTTSDCPRSSQPPPCCLHGGGRCSNYGEWSRGAGSDDNCDAADWNREPPGRNDKRSPIWGTRNGGRLSPLRFRDRNQSVAQSARLTTLSRIPVPCPSRPDPPVRQDRPVDLYAGSRLPVPIRPGPAPTRIPRIDRTCDSWPSPSSDNDQTGCRYTIDADPVGATACDLSQSRDAVHDTDGGLRDTDDRLHDTDDDGGNVDDDLLDSQTDGEDTSDDVPGQPRACVDESAASATLEKWVPPALDDFSSTGSQPLTAMSLDGDCRGSLEGCRSGDHGCLSDASDLNRSVESCADSAETDRTA